ncbi:MAG: nicotinate-nucleotide--dimethylbenzimidazole phosphoribosyltransferase [Thermodesulfovibrionales bacterium]|nr:nicotinate-nucleotide--dimethylbenzimidazole phosphoribosyltransferase [Thermodesulfovibrionales bacterium]
MIKDAIAKIESLDNGLFEKAQARLDILTKPQGSLGRLEEFAARLVAITGETMPDMGKKVIFTFAGDHGVTKAGVSAFPSEVTPQMVLNFLAGGAGINVLARHAGADVAVVDIGVNYDFGQAGGLIHKKVVKGTANMLEGPAMTRQEAEACIEVGIELVREYKKKGYGIVGTGDMGIGNTTPSSAIAAVITGETVANVTGYGTGITDEAFKNKISVIEQVIKKNSPDAADGLDVLAKVGGAEIAGIAGVCIGAASEGMPVVVDGMISTAGALIAYTIEPKCAEYMFAAHKSVEIGQSAMLAKMGLEPIVDLGMRLGEGTGAALGMTLIEAGLKIYKEMATFESAGVTDKAD